MPIPVHGSIKRHISFWCNQIGSAFLRINSSTGKPSMVGGRFTRFCLPLMKITRVSSFRRRFAARSLAVNFRFDMLLPGKAHIRGWGSSMNFYRIPRSYEPTASPQFCPPRAARISNATPEARLVLRLRPGSECREAWLSRMHSVGIRGPVRPARESLRFSLPFWGILSATHQLFRRSPLKFISTPSGSARAGPAPGFD